MDRGARPSLQLMPRSLLPASHREQWRRELAADNVWDGEWPHRLVDLGAAVGVAAVILDVIVTYLALSGSGYAEQNPFAASLMEAIGLAPTLLVSGFLRVAVIGALAYLATRAIRPVVRYAALATLLAAATWWCVVDFSNAMALAQGSMGRG
jgi:Domain of unknown function (DUF5658)